MNGVLMFISKFGDSAIIILGFTVAVVLIVNSLKLMEKKNRIEEAVAKKSSKYFMNAINRELSEEEEADSLYSPDKIRAAGTEFNSVCAIHDIFVQFIPLFPLFGILGTVAGLILQVQGGADVAVMLASLGTALSTTFWGLVWTIALKILEAVLPARIINEVDIMLEDFEKKMSIAEVFQTYENEKM